MESYIGKILDNRYEILESIGKGGMAVVYKAKCHLLNRLVAVKILKNDLDHDEDFRRRFNAESQAIAQLSHPNIVSVYDVSRGGDTEYIVMELIDGITLKQYMERRGQLNWQESLHFITQIIRGIGHAHSRGIIHRDIKPQNIMVLRDGSVRVTDFGIACLENSNQTMTQEALGSVHYISPEQAKGDRIDSRSDLYSAGVVLYEMLTGRLPFEGDSPVSVAIQHLSSIPLAPREINPDIPEALELICMKAMASDISKRYASADAMISDLEAFRKNPGVALDIDPDTLHAQDQGEPTQPLPMGGGRRNESEPRGGKHLSEPEEPEGEKTDRRKVILAAAAGVLAVILAFVLMRSILNSFGNKTDQYVVQSVLGLTVEEAQELEGVKDVFTIEVKADHVFSDEYPAGTIAKQEPAEGEHRKGENTVITVWISDGEDTGEMIDVTKKTVAQANQDLKNLVKRYELIVAEPTNADLQFHDTIEEGFIISTVPAAGEPLKKGDTVSFVVSKGPDLKPTPVPNFVGDNFYEILPQISAVWKLNCDEAYDMTVVQSDQPYGTIIWQSIPANTTAMEGDTIQFQISAGPGPASRDFDIELPRDGRREVYIEVYVGDEQEPQFAQTVMCRGADKYATIYLTGSGVQSVRVFFDGDLVEEQSYDMQFS